MKIPDQDYDTLLDDVFIKKIILIYTYITFNEILVYKPLFVSGKLLWNFQNEFTSSLSSF